MEVRVRSDDTRHVTSPFGNFIYSRTQRDLVADHLIRLAAMIREMEQ